MPIYNYVNTENAIDFVTGQRDHLKKAQKNPADSADGGLNDVMFAQDSGTIIVGDVEYGAYYPGTDVKSTATNNKVGKLEEGHNRAYFEGRPIRDILDEILFVTPTLLNVNTEDGILSYDSGIKGQPSIVANNLPKVVFTITNSEGLAVSDFNDIKINNIGIIPERIDSNTFKVTQLLYAGNFLTNVDAVEGTITNGVVSTDFVNGFNDDGDYVSYAFDAISKDYTVTLTGTIKGKTISKSLKVTLSISEGTNGNNPSYKLKKLAKHKYGFTTATGYVEVGAIGESIPNVKDNNSYCIVSESALEGSLSYDINGATAGDSAFSITNVTDPSITLTSNLRGTNITDASITLNAVASDWVMDGTTLKPILTLTINVSNKGSYIGFVNNTFLSAPYDGKNYLCYQSKLRSSLIVPANYTGVYAESGTITTRKFYPYYPVQLTSAGTWKVSTSNKEKLLANKTLVSGKSLSFTYSASNVDLSGSVLNVGYVVIDSALNNKVSATVTISNLTNSMGTKLDVNFGVSLTPTTINGNNALKISISNYDTLSLLTIASANSFSGTVNVSFN